MIVIFYDSSIKIIDKMQLMIYNLDSKNKNNHFITVLYIPISANNAPITQNKLNG